MEYYTRTYTTASGVDIDLFAGDKRIPVGILGVSYSIPRAAWPWPSKKPIIGSLALGPESSLLDFIQLVPLDFTIKLSGENEVDQSMYMVLEVKKATSFDPDSRTVSLEYKSVTGWIPDKIEPIDLIKEIP